MRNALAATLGFITAITAAPAISQENSSEIVVTASRYQDRFEETQPPWVSITRRADFVVVGVDVSCDTRDPRTRKAEMTKTLQALVARAKASRGTIVVSINTDDVITDFDEGGIATALAASDDYEEVTVSLTVKTPVRPDDTLDAARKRIVDFAEAVPTTGRALVIEDDDTGLSVVRPGQYRYDLVAAMAADAAKITAAFGPGYAVAVTGMESPIAWKQTGPLEITLFQPHSLSVGKAD